MNRKAVFGIIGWSLIALTAVGFVVRALLQIETGHWAYRNYKYQWMTYLGTLATLGIAAGVGLIGLYYRVKRLLQEKRRARE